MGRHAGVGSEEAADGALCHRCSQSTSTERSVDSRRGAAHPGRARRAGWGAARPSGGAPGGSGKWGASRGRGVKKSPRCARAQRRSVRRGCLQAPWQAARAHSTHLGRRRRVGDVGAHALARALALALAPAHARAPLALLRLPGVGGGVDAAALQPAGVRTPVWLVVAAEGAHVSIKPLCVQPAAAQHAPSAQEPARLCCQAER